MERRADRIGKGTRERRRSKTRRICRSDRWREEEKEKNRKKRGTTGRRREEEKEKRSEEHEEEDRKEGTESRWRFLPPSVSVDVM